ncbi:MAG: hypothetical protein IKY59_05695 [Oscillospiraceae bacterium]|nr:hypothetical protein [Oscillospiraceae bacterium]MBR4972445.1 hypothetical protein [Oscillospiraceae bacterium]
MMKYEKPVAAVVSFAGLERIARTDVSLDIDLGVDLGGAQVSEGASDDRD